MTQRPSRDRIDLELLDRFLAGDCTPDETAAVERWVAARPANAALLATLKLEFGRGADEPEPSDASAVWERLARRLGQGGERQREQRRGAGAAIPLHVVSTDAAPADRSASSETPVRASRSRSWAVGAAAAAAAAIIVVGGSTLLLRGGGTDHASPTASAFAARSYVTARGQRAYVRLADGTRVALAPASRLTVSAGYDSVSREVTLEGEAYFDVLHDARRPFVVRARHAVIRDLGTRFGVRGYGGDRWVRIVVTDGRVRVSSRAAASDAGVLLRRGDLGRVGLSGETSVVHGGDTVSVLSWTAGTLVFNRTPVLDALADIGRWFDVDFSVVDSSLERRTLSARLRDQSLDEVLDLVAMALDARIERHGRSVILRAREGARSP